MAEPTPSHTPRRRVPLPIVTGDGAPAVTPRTSVREILARFPATAAVFDRHGLSGCGGAEGPDEPLDLFARAHHVDLPALLRELTAAAADTTGGTATPPAATTPTPARYRRFVVTALAFALTFGAGLGALLLAAMTLPWSVLASVPTDAARIAHAHAQVFGFAALFIMGVAYHALPRIKSVPLAAPPLVAASYWLQTAGVLLIAFGALTGTPPLGAAARLAGAAALLLAALAFAWVIERTLAAGSPAPERFEAFLRAGCTWLVVAAGIGVSVAAGRDALRAAMWDAALYGFAASWIFGFSLRILPVFLGTVPASRGRELLCAVYQAAVALWVGVAVVEAWRLAPLTRAAAGAALAVAGALVVARLGIFARRDVGSAAGEGWQKFVFAAYGWMLVGLLFVPAWSAAAALDGAGLPALVLDFGRHAFTIGFLTQMIIGVATRILPVFSGKALWSPRWREATFYLLNAALLARGLEVVVELGGPERLWPWVALSGPLGVGAFTAFAVNLFMTLSGRAVTAAARRAPAAPPSADSIVADLLHIPGALDLLVSRGFAPLRNPVMRATMAHAITLGQACRMHGIAVEPLVDALRELAARDAADAPQGAAAS